MFRGCCNIYCFCGLISLLLFAGSLTGVILLSFHLDDGCPKVESCYYQVQSSVYMNITLYRYYYGINNQWTCSDFCSNPLDLSSCPVNNSQCYVTDEIGDFCKYHGFEHLFKPCFNDPNTWLQFMCGVCMVVFILCSCLCVKFSYDEVKPKNIQHAYESNSTPYVPPVSAPV